MSFELPVARYRLECEATTDLHLPEYSGSALRGAFGQALRSLVCVTNAPRCETCGHYRGCQFPAIFKPPAPPEHRLQKFTELPAPYVIEPLPWDTRHIPAGHRFVFHLVLVGRAIAQLPLIVLAWQRALGAGIGARQGRARLLALHYVVGETCMPVWSEHAPRVVEHTPRLPDPPNPRDTVTLRLLTPLRIQHNGRPLDPKDISAPRLLVGLIKRTGLLLEAHTGSPCAIDFSGLAAHARTIRETRDLTWRDWKRYSSTQKQDMALGGVMGRWRLSGDLAPFWPFLHAGQWLHVGKNATFGLGHYTIESA